MTPIIAIIIGLILISALVGLAAAESALNGMSRSRAEALEEEGVPGAELLVASLADRRRVLAPILALSLGSQLTLGALVALVVEQQFGVAWVPLGIFAALVFMLVLTESVPKTWAMRNIDRVAPRAARFSNLVRKVPPLGWILAGLGTISSALLSNTARSAGAVASEEEIVAMTDAAVAEDVLDEDEGEIIHSILDFGDTIVREVMVPRPDVLTASADTKIDDAIGLLVERGHSRMPIYGEDMDDIKGIVHIKDLFARAQRGRGDHFVSIAGRSPVFVPETKRAADLLRELKGVPTSLVVVVDEYGSTAGIVTLEDLIEEFLGEIVDEFDAQEEPMIETVKAGEWRVLGGLPIDEFNEAVGASLPDDDWDTIGGLIFDGLGHVPVVGESIRRADLDFTVEGIEGRRITRVLVQDPSGTGDLTARSTSETA